MRIGGKVRLCAGLELAVRADQSAGVVGPDEQVVRGLVLGAFRDCFYFYHCFIISIIYYTQC